MNKSLLILFLVIIAKISHADFHRDTMPYYPFGKLDGFKVINLKSKNSSFAKAGVETGDVVLSVNGRRISSIEEAKKAYQLKSLNEIVVLRNNSLKLLKKGAEK